MSMWSGQKDHKEVKYILYSMVTDVMRLNRVKYKGKEDNNPRANSHFKIKDYNFLLE